MKKNYRNKLNIDNWMIRIVYLDSAHARASYVSSSSSSEENSERQLNGVDQYSTDW